jgi:hypothetical protein
VADNVVIINYQIIINGMDLANESLKQYSELMENAIKFDVNAVRMFLTARSTYVAYTIVIATYVIAVAAAFMAAKAFPIQMACAQNVQTTPPSTSAPTYTSPSDNNTTTNSASGNATK